jgi:type II secretion system protein D
VQTTTAVAQAPLSLVLLPLTRQNAILVAAPRSQMKYLIEQISKLDINNTAAGKAVPFPLKRASASQVEQKLNAWYAQRYPAESQQMNQIRFTHDDNTNTVFVQAAPADMAEIRTLIEYWDSSNKNAANSDIRIIQLRNAYADELAPILIKAISEGVAVTSGTTTGAPGAPGLPGGPAALALQQARPVTPGAPGAGLVTKTTNLRLIVGGAKGKPTGIVQSSVLEDVRINYDARTNQLIVIAPRETIPLIEALVFELDIVPVARSEINIFNLRKTDAATMASMLQQLFLGGAATGAFPRATTVTPGSTTTGPGGVGPAAALPGAAATGGPGTALGTTGNRPLQITIGRTTPEGTPLVDLRITVDERTNSLLVAGSRNDLDVIEVLIDKLETANIFQRRFEVVRLKNAIAADLAASLQDFITKNLNVLRSANLLTAFQEAQRDIVISVEPVTNSLLISATQGYFDMLMRVIVQLDLMPPQVMIQVLVAEVDLSNEEEFGMEIGLQSPVLFQRSILFPAPGGTASYTGASAPPPTFTVNSIVPPAVPGFAFTNPNTTLGNNPLIGPNVVGVQGITNLGVGRVSNTQNIGGFVFSAGSDAFNLLIRALKVQNRIDILSRPQIMTLDNQTAIINIGQDIPIVSTSNVTATGVISNSIDRRNVGVIFQVTPKITPEGRVLMRVIPEVSSVASQTVPLGNGSFGTSINIQHMEATVSAYDGETVAIGGLIAWKDNKTENKVPWVGDLPYVGAAFRYRTQAKTKTELLFMLSPHIVRCRADAERIFALETKRMDWILRQAARVHGTENLSTILPPNFLAGKDGSGNGNGNCPGGCQPGTVPGLSGPALPLANPAPLSPVLPAPSPVLPTPMPVGPGGPATDAPPAGPTPQDAVPPPLNLSSNFPPAPAPPVTPAAPPPAGTLSGQPLLPAPTPGGQAGSRQTVTPSAAPQDGGAPTSQGREGQSWQQPNR